MPSDFSLARSNVVILGLGLMGGSLAMSLRGHCASLLGVDPHPAALELALSLAIVDRASADPAPLLPEADVIILAAPVDEILALLAQLPALTPNPCIVLDLGSTKRLVLEAMSRLPARFEPIGGHPLCGKEKLSLVHAEAGMYRDAAFFLSPPPNASPRALSAAHQVIQAIGARAIVVDAGEHDRMLAFTSHLPFLLSCALALTAPGEATPFAGSGFRSASRLAGTPASMMSAVLRSNRENVLAALSRAQDHLANLESALASGDEAELNSLLDLSRASYLNATSAPDH